MRRPASLEAKMERQQELASDIAAVEAYADYSQGSGTKVLLKNLSIELRRALVALERGE